MSEGVFKKISRVIFWRYRRGGWQYDILCIVILLFIFLVPNSVLDGSYFNEDGSVSSVEVTEESQSADIPPQEQSKPETKQAPAVD